MGVKKGVALNRSFTQIPNDLIRNRGVSDGAFRLICWITSHTDGFDVSFSGIRAALGYGRDGLRSIIKNAEENNYLVRVRTRDEKTGQFDWDYHIFASQQDAIAFRESIDGLTTPGVTIDGSAVGGSPTGGSATGGSDYPHKEYKEEEKQSKKEQSKNTPLTPQGEECVTQSVLVEVVEEEADVNSSTFALNPPSLTETNKTLPEDKDSGHVATKQKKNRSLNNELQVFLDAYQAEKPSNFTNHRELSDKHTKALSKLVSKYKERSLDIFVAALTWCREQEGDWWRNKPLSLDNLMSNGKLVEFADKHFDAMDSDPAYCDRVNGRQISFDAKRTNGCQILNENGEELTGASAQIAQALANDPFLQMLVEAR